MGLLKSLEPEIVGVCMYITDIEKFAEKIIKEKADVEIKTKVTIKQEGNNLDLVVSIISDSLSTEEEERLLRMEIDPLDPEFNGRTIEGHLMDELGGWGFIPGIGVDDKLGEYILFQVPFDSYIEEMGYRR